MIKILLISENEPSPIGGLERHCYNLMSLFKNSQDVEILSLSKENIKYSFIRGINKIVFDKKDLYEKISNSGADVVHIHGFASFTVPQVIDCAYRLKKKIVYTAHYHPFYTLDNPTLGKLFFHILLKNKLKKVNAIISINQDDTSFFKKYNSNVNMIPHWLNERVTTIPDRTNKNKILYIGRSEPNKGINHLYSLPKNQYEIHCVSSGKFARNDFIIHSNISEEGLYKLYSESSVVVIPSRYEAFSYVALESLSVGTPIVISDRVRIADYLNDFKGKGVEVFKFNDFKMFNLTIERTIGQSVDIDSINSIFDKNTIRKKFETIYKSN